MSLWPSIAPVLVHEKPSYSVGAQNLWILEEEENVEESGRRLQSWRRDDAIDSNDYSSHE
jgi:hypothetical protein